MPRSSYAGIWKSVFQIGSHGLPPVHPVWQCFLDGPQSVVGRRAARWIGAILDGANGPEQKLAEHNDRPVRRAEPLPTAIDNPAHAFLHGVVRGVDPLDTRKAASALRLAVDHPLGIAIAELAEVDRRVEIFEADTLLMKGAFHLAWGGIDHAVDPVPDHAVVVVHGDPVVTCDVGAIAFGAAKLLWPDL